MFKFFGKKKDPPQQNKMPRNNARPTYDGALYSHVRGAEITAGAEVYAFVQRFDKPQYDIIGAGFQVMEQMRPFQEPQVFANLAVPNNGLGGLSSGQMVSLGLVNNDYSQIE